MPRKEQGVRMMRDGKWEWHYCWQGKRHRHVAQTADEAERLLAERLNALEAGRYSEAARERGIKRLPDGRWQWSYKDPSGKYHRHVARTKTEANAYLEKTKTTIREGRYLDKQPQARTTLEEGVPAFLLWSQNTLRQNGYQTDIWASRFWLESKHLRGKLLDRITPGDVERFKQDLALTPRKRRRGGITKLGETKWRITWSRNGRPHRRTAKSESDARKLLDEALSGVKDTELLSKKAQDEVLGRLKRFFALAVMWGTCNQNPAAAVKLCRVDNKRHRYLTEAEETRLLAVCSPYLRRIVVFALSTGLRRSELLGLRWQDVDLQNGVVLIPATRSKSKKDRYVPLCAAASAVLKELEGDQEKSALVFGNGAGNLQGNLKRIWGAALEASGVQDLHFHDLRHSFASRLVSAGVDLAVIRELLGHADYTMTLRYSHLQPSRLREAVKVLDGKLRTSCKREKPAAKEHAGLWLVA